MCGIAGGYKHSISPDEGREILRRLHHRGPDGNGFWQHEDVWIASTRLAIQDLSPAGSQPMCTPDKQHYIVYNGELYNAPDLRERLIKEGVTFHTRCDTEIVLNAYAAWGEKCLGELEGDFAFAVWNDIRKELFIARDPVGVKPLYIYSNDGQVLFASEIKALLGLKGLNYALRPEVFSEYVAYLYSPSEATPFQYISKLLPGHYLRFSMNEDARKPVQYYRIPMNGREDAGRDWPQEVEHTLSDVVRRQLYADVPVGIMLSGGLDSSLIAALAKKAVPDMPLQAFTIRTSGMAAEGFEEDIQYARKMAAHLDLPLHEVDGMPEPSGSWIDRLIWQMDEPQADPAAWYTALIASEARHSGIKVLLSGTGGDDVFSGYRRHRAISSFAALQFLPGGLNAAPEALQRIMPGSDHPKLRRLAKLLSGAGLSPQKGAINSHFWISPELLRRLMSAAYPPPSDPYLLFKKLLEEIPDEHDLLQQMLFLEQRTFLPHHNLAYMDKMGMTHSVEIRVPFADRQVVSLAAAMPASLKLQGHTTKAILRKIAGAYMPRAIIDRSKTGFGAPLRQWMRGPLKELTRDRLSDKSFRENGFFNSDTIQKLMSDNERGRNDHSYTLFSLLCIESWLRQFAHSS
jgi:asparagine synthase (glutamine-hydrolysing)